MLLNPNDVRPVGDAGRKSVAEWETTSSTSTFLFGDKYSERIAEMRAEEKKKRKVLKYDPRKLPSNISCWARPARPEMRDVQGFLKGTISPVAGQPQQNFRGKYCPALHKVVNCAPALSVALKASRNIAVKY